MNRLRSMLIAFLAILAPATSRAEDLAQALAGLGYLPQAHTAAQTHPTPGVLATASAAYLDFHGLPKSADPVNAAAEHIGRRLPRCGEPDILHATTEEAGLCKWPHVDVSCYNAIKVSTLSDAEVKEAYEAALQSWNDVAGINLHSVATERANIVSRSGLIDGNGRVLAFSNLPCGVSASDTMNQKYDTGERWSKSFLQEVVAHEVGHAIGLNHLRAGNLMAPYATGNLIVPQKGDVAEAVARYGEPKPKAPTPPSPPPTPPGGGPYPPTIEGVIRLNGFAYTLAPWAGGIPAPGPGEGPAPEPAPAPAPKAAEDWTVAGFTGGGVLVAGALLYAFLLHRKAA